MIGAVPASSVRSYLQLNTPALFCLGMDRAQEGVKRGFLFEPVPSAEAEFLVWEATLVGEDCLSWFERQPAASLTAGGDRSPIPGFDRVLGSGTGKLLLRGVWTPTHAKPAPLPRLRGRARTVLHGVDTAAADSGSGANVVVSLQQSAASSALSAVGSGAARSSRLVMTMRGGDRPKDAHVEFSDVSVMARSMREPWLVFRKPIEGRVQDNLRKWGTGGFRRFSAERPFGDVIVSAPTCAAERALAQHPSLKPQAFLRQLVRGVLPLGKGVVLDPFAGSGSTSPRSLRGYRLQKRGCGAESQVLRSRDRGHTENCGNWREAGLDFVDPSFPEFRYSGCMKCRGSGTKNARGELGTRTATLHAAGIAKLRKSWIYKV